MFNMRNFVRKTVFGMIGKEPEYKVRQYALSWLGDGRLTEEDLAEIDERYAAMAEAAEAAAAAAENEEPAGAGAEQAEEE